MAIRDKDGKVYKLQGPNPLMKNQEKWDMNDIVLHNFKWGSETIKDTNKAHKFLSDLNIKEDSNIAVMPATEAPTYVELDESPEPIVEPPKMEQETQDIFDQRKTLIHCLPIVIEQFTDALYGDSYKRTTFGQKFGFYGIIVDIGDLGIQFWSYDEIIPGSIVFPEMKLKRWWKVTESEDKTGGYLSTALPSDYSPDLS